MMMEPSACAPDAAWRRAQEHRSAGRAHEWLLELQRLGRLQPRYPGLLQELQAAAARCLQERHARRAAGGAAAAAAGAAAAAAAGAGSPAGAEHWRAQHLRVLGLAPGAAQAQVRGAYKQLAVAHHPDKWAGAAPAAQRRAQERFVAVRRAYEALLSGEGGG
jgi:hypothetical protein